MIHNLYYALVVLLAIIIQGIVNYDTFYNAGNSKETRKYRQFLIFVWLYYGIDGMWGVLNLLGAVRFFYIDCVAYSLTMAISLAMCFQYIVTYLELKPSLAKLLNGLCNTVVIGDIILLTINNFYPFYFWIDDAGTYQTGWFRPIAMGIEIFFFALISILTFSSALSHRNIHEKRSLAIFLFGITIVVSLACQSMFPLFPSYTIGLLIGTLINHIFIREERRRKKLNEIQVLNKQLEEAKQMADKASSAKTAFLFNMSHDIRTPMNAIVGFRNLLEKYQDDPVRRKDYLQKIGDASNVLLSTINDVLEIARIEKGTFILEETAWDVKEFNDSLYTMINDLMAQKGINFTRTINTRHQYVCCDAIKLREVFINLLSNAQKYTPRGGSVLMQLEETDSNREGYATFQTKIIDTGIGMTAEFLPHLFDEFSREEISTVNKIEGTGLGMSIVKKLVDLMGGTIEVESAKDKGTTFTITLQHRICEKPEWMETDEKAASDLSSLQGRRILLAEDNDLNAEIAIEILSDYGLKIERAEDGQIAVGMLDKADEHYYDMILMDVHMPNMNGYEATQAIRAMQNQVKANIPIIAMTANAFHEDRMKSFEAGMNGHLAKPFEINELLKILMQHIG